ncbi:MULTISPECIES: PAS domain S-box protein [Calothrix]|uniref:PAS domain S-box protein n=2 Tax=Calothrix TaxID=1186 RepID=A0ABR8ABR6_9CYAN|nr:MULTISPECIES: PAS domain S-box protein [Calothrix]MBD2196748.1 PAS domain S-box protein [Calothrix parietina FACHB-288]MBD2225300.1 PAS domain S-box protein [Calothrix anomala FACHB-343]
MQAIPQLLWIKCLESIIDFSPLTVEPETLLLDAIALMSQQGKIAVVTSSARIFGCLTEKDIVRLLASEIDLKNTKISQVMHPATMTFKQSQLENLAILLTQLRQSPLGLLLVVDEQERLIGTITKESSYQLLDSDLNQQQPANSDRQVTLEALRNSEERFRHLVETSSDLIWEVDKNGLYTYVSPKIRDILGYEPEEILEDV